MEKLILNFRVFLPRRKYFNIEIELKLAFAHRKYQ